MVGYVADSAVPDGFITAASPVHPVVSVSGATGGEALTVPRAQEE